MLRVEGLVKRFGTLEVLKELDLHVREGEKVALMGPSGCGKSTLLRCVNRLVEPDAGSVFVDGEDVLSLHGAALEALRRRIGFVFQQGHLVGRLSVLDNVTMPLHFAGLERDEALLRARDALAQVEMWSLRRRRPGQLSGGERQRVSIARTLALVRESHTTMLIVTHEAAFARRFADRIVLMDEGRIVEAGPAARVLETPQSEVGHRYRRLLTA